MKMSNNGLNLVISFEGLYLNAYKCPAGVWTIGYGHTGKVGKDCIRSGMEITKAKAISLLKSDMKQFEKSVASLVKVPLNQNQFDALISFAFNVGSGSLKSSTLLKKLNKKDYKGAAEQFLVWNKARVNGKLIELPGLTRRRKAERELFLTPIKKQMNVYSFDKFVNDLKEIKGKKLTTDKLLKKLPTINNVDNKNTKVIKPLKKYLKKLGYYNGTIDTVYNVALSAAVKKYKNVKKLDSKSGTIGSKFWKSILKL